MEGLIHMGLLWISLDNNAASHWTQLNSRTSETFWYYILCCTNIKYLSHIVFHFNPVNTFFLLSAIRPKKRPFKWKRDTGAPYGHILWQCFRRNVMSHPAALLCPKTRNANGQSYALFPGSSRRLTLPKNTPLQNGIGMSVFPYWRVYTFTDILLFCSHFSLLLLRVCVPRAYRSRSPPLTWLF